MRLPCLLKHGCIWSTTELRCKCKCIYFTLLSIFMSNYTYSSFANTYFSFYRGRTTIKDIWLESILLLEPHTLHCEGDKLMGRQYCVAVWLQSFSTTVRISCQKSKPASELTHAENGLAEAQTTEGSGPTRMGVPNSERSDRWKRVKPNSRPPDLHRRRAFPAKGRRSDRTLIWGSHKLLRTMLFRMCQRSRKIQNSIRIEHTMGSAVKGWAWRPQLLLCPASRLQGRLLPEIRICHLDRVPFFVNTSTHAATGTTCSRAEGNCLESGAQAECEGMIWGIRVLDWGILMENLGNEGESPKSPRPVDCWALLHL
jgi:hypothetical protein